MRNCFLLLMVFGCFSTMIYSCQSSDQVTQAMYYTNGHDLYVRRCQNCHGEHGEGLEALIPPLTDKAFLKDHKRSLACIIKNGLDQRIQVDNRYYQEKMPAASDLNDIDIAQLIVYITNVNGSKQGMYSTSQVAVDLADCK
jgi:mono/diheme cytochrome c family protein